MEKRKFYVSAKKESLDLGMEIEAENIYMAAAEFANDIWEVYDLSNVIITEVEEVSDDK